MFVLVMLIMITISTCQSLACNQYGKYYRGDPLKKPYVFSVLYGGVCIIFTFIFTACTGGIPLTISLPTVVLGLVNGIVLTIYNHFFLKASATGPYSIVIIFMLSGGLAIPILWSVIIDGNVLNIMQWIAFVLTLISVFILNIPRKGEQVSVRFLVYCTLLGIANGIYGILINSQQAMSDNMENAAMIMLTFGTCAVLSFFIMILPVKGKSVPSHDAKQCLFIFCRRSFVWGLASALCASISVNILMWILSKINVAVVYAFVNGGVLLVSSLISLIFLGEKRTFTKVVGIILSAVAIVMLSI